MVEDFIERYAEMQRKRRNNDFENEFGGNIPPNEKGIFHKKNKNCPELYKTIYNEVKKEKEN